MIKLKQLLENKESKVKRIFLDMDGVLCAFSEQYKKYLANDNLWNSVINSKKIISQNKLDTLGIDKAEFLNRAEIIRQKALSSNTDSIYDIVKQTFKKELLISPSWTVIAYGGEEFWSTMNWNPGGKELVDFVKSTGIHTEILTAGMGSHAANGKQAWLKKHGLGNIPFNIVRSGLVKHEYASTGDMLIDDMEENIKLFIQAGGMGIIHKNTSQTINELKSHL
jgi:hypothetical protein